jgi:hypothetical protein
MRIVKALAVIIPLLAATLALVFRVRPSLKPCVGASGAEFTGAPVFPRVRFRDHLFRSGASRAELRGEPNILGAEVRFSYKTARLVTPDACSETGGQDIFVQIPDRRKRYRVVLEMYRSGDLEDRLALADTPIFSG